MKHYKRKEKKDWIVLSKHRISGTLYVYTALPSGYRGFIKADRPVEPILFTKETAKGVANIERKSALK